MARVTEIERATPSEPASDEDLVRRAAAGELEAFAELYARFYGGTLRLAFAMTGSRETAEDATQEIFMRVYGRLHQFERRAKFSTWFHRIAVNHCLRFRARAWARRAERAADDLASPDAERPEDAILRAQLHDEVHRALISLRPKQRVIVILKEIEGLTYAEIADRVGCSEGTVASRLARARQLLARKLAHLRGAV